MAEVKITQIPLLNSVVIKQKDIHFFIAAPNSFIIDREGWLRLTEELMRIGFIAPVDIVGVLNKVIGTGVEDADKEDNSDSN
jgi:hypothetical protein